MPHGPVRPFGGAIFPPCPCVFLLVLPVQFDRPKRATVCVSQRHSCPRHGNLLLPALTGAFHTGLACYYYLSLLSITQISTMLIHVFGKRGGTSARPRRPCQPLFPAVTTGDCGSRAQRRTSFARRKRAHTWAEVISASATRVCWISAGVGAESGSPLGLIVPVFWHTEHNSLLHQTPD